MRTYYLLDAASNTWSLKAYTLPAIMDMPGITDGHLLADAQTQQPLTLAQARMVARHKARLLTPEFSLLRKSHPAAGAQKTSVPPADVPKNAVPKSAAPPPAGKAFSATKGGAVSRREYKVLTPADIGSDGRVCARALAHTLNAYAGEGWRVLNCHISRLVDTAEGRRRSRLLFWNAPCHMPPVENRRCTGRACD